MVLSGSVEPLHYPAIMFSLPLAASPPPSISPHCHQRYANCHHLPSFSPFSFPNPFPPLTWLATCCSISLSLWFRLFISDPILVQTFTFLCFMLPSSFTLIYQLFLVYLLCCDSPPPPTNYIYNTKTSFFRRSQKYFVHPNATKIVNLHFGALGKRKIPHNAKPFSYLLCLFRNGLNLRCCLINTRCGLLSFCMLIKGLTIIILSQLSQFIFLHGNSNVTLL